MTVKHILTELAPAPRAPYSQATVATGSLIFVSGQGPFTPEGDLVSGSFEVAARRTFENVLIMVTAAGGDSSSIVRVGVFLRDMDDFAAMNEIYREFFPDPLPARTTIQSNLPRFPIEVDAIAVALA